MYVQYVCMYFLEMLSFYVCMLILLFPPRMLSFFACIYVCMFMYVCMYVYVHYVYVCMYVCTNRDYNAMLIDAPGAQHLQDRSDVMLILSQSLH